MEELETTKWKQESLIRADFEYISIHFDRGNGGEAKNHEMKNLVSKTIQISTAQKYINRKPRNDKDRCDPVDPQFRFLFRKHLIIKLKQNKRYLNSSNFFENTNFHNQ